MRFRHTTRAAALLAALTILAPLLPEARAEAALPDAAKVLERYIEVTGGMAAYDKIENRVTAGSLELAGQGITLQMKIYQARPGLSYQRIESDVTGKIERGTRDGIAWESSMMTGPRLLEGDERELALYGATLDPLVHWRENYESVETVGTETIGDEETYKVLAVPKLGPEQTIYFGKESGLVVKTAMTVKSPMGEVPFESYAGDYRDADGILYAHRAEIDVMGGKRIVTMDSIEHNVELPAGVFELPDAIKALMSKDESSE